MLLGLLTTVFVGICILLALAVLIQKGSNSMGLGGFASNVMLFGGSGGQPILQKATWILGTLFLCGSLILSIAKTREARVSRFISENQMQMPRPQ